MFIPVTLPKPLSATIVRPIKLVLYKLGHIHFNPELIHLLEEIIEVSPTSYYYLRAYLGRKQ